MVWAALGAMAEMKTSVSAMVLLPEALLISQLPSMVSTTHPSSSLHQT